VVLWVTPTDGIRQRISERLARLDGERTKLGNQLNELEIAERILTRFGGTAEETEKRKRGRRARTAPAAGRQRRARGGQQAPTLSMKWPSPMVLHRRDGSADSHVAQRITATKSWNSRG
jgi:hypothetical protein